MTATRRRTRLSWDSPKAATWRSNIGGQTTNRSGYRNWLMKPSTLGRLEKKLFGPSCASLNRDGMIREARMAQLGFFDAEKRLAALSAKGDPLEAIDRLVPRESFRADIKAVVLTPDETRRAILAGSRSMRS